MKYNSVLKLTYMSLLLNLLCIIKEKDYINYIYTT